MAGGVYTELRVVRLVATLGFFWSVVMTIVTLQIGQGAWGYGVGALMCGIMMGFLWKDDLAATGNAREQQKAADITREQQGMPMFPASPNPAPASTQALPPGPSAPIQHSGG